MKALYFLLSVLCVLLPIAILEALVRHDPNGDMDFSFTIVFICVIAIVIGFYNAYLYIVEE